MSIQHQAVDGTRENKPDAPAGPREIPSSRASNWRDRTNMMAVVLMAAATLGSSWSAYQSSLWNGIQIFKLNDAAALSREADEKTTQAGQQRALDIALFVQSARDLFEGKQRQVEFVLERMRPEFRQAVEAWLATEPQKNPNAPSTPFAMPQYRQPLADQAAEFERKSASLYRDAQRANRTSDKYTLIGVLYTSALFLSGLVSGFDQKQVRRVLLVISVSTLALALVIMLQQPLARPG